ncbi:MAG: 50S ribosomal protein L25 [Planctomycetia bacterium]|nr:50S ribosomal protein L25 [Planctomycetia bacterium]
MWGFPRGVSMSDSVEVKLRKEKGSRASRRLRNEGLVPAILYGHGEKCVDLVATREAVHAAVRHGSRIVELKGAVKTSALIRELQWDTFGVEPVHVDFLRVSASDRIKVKVPVDLRGECPGQRAGGVVSLILHEIELECTADAVPEKIHAVVGKLQLGGSIKVHDLELPPGARPLLDGDETVVTCTVPVEKAEETGTGGAEPELIGRKAAEEGEAEAEKS